MRIMINWNGKEIKSAISRGGVKVLAHPYDNLIRTGCYPWPPPEIVQKLYQSRQVRAFDKDQLSICTSGLGYYCDLQSLHSEDAITWSVFGTAKYHDKAAFQVWLSELLNLLDLPDVSVLNAKLFLWRRTPHPDTLTMGGPEIDVGIITDNAVILCEAKWQSGIGSRQGKKKDKDQLQLRGELLQKYGAKIFPNHSLFAVVGIGLHFDSFIDTTPDGVQFRSITWEDVCGLKSHPIADEVQRYYGWKKSNSKMFRSNNRRA